MYRPSGLVIDRNNIFYILINNLKTAGFTEIAMPFMSFSDNLLLDAYIFHKNVDYFEIVHKTCYILVWDSLPP